MRYFWKRLLFHRPSRHHPTEWHQQDRTLSSRTWMMLIFTLTSVGTMMWVWCFHAFYDCTLNQQACCFNWVWWNINNHKSLLTHCKVYWCSAKWWYDDLFPLGIGEWAFWRCFVWIYGWEEGISYKNGTHWYQNEGKERKKSEASQQIVNICWKLSLGEHHCLCRCIHCHCLFWCCCATLQTTRCSNITWTRVVCFHPATVATTCKSWDP